MIYFKISQPIPGKGDAWMYYECNDDQSVRRYLTYIPSTGEVEKVAKPFMRKLQQPEMLMPASQEEFHRYWPPDEDDETTTEDVIREAVEEQGIKGKRYFDPNMTVGEAMATHPQVAEVFAAFHLGGCSSCGISEVETVAQVCYGYGIDLEILLDVLEGLMDKEEEASEPDEKSAAAVD